LVYKNYYDIVKTYENFPHTVWADEAQQTPTYTLYGEFSDNGFSVKKGITDNLFGSLSMYYTSKTTSEDKVSVKRADGDGYSNKQYKYNSATSMFAIALSESATTNSAYCTFATLVEGSVDTLKDLKEAIKGYEDDLTNDYTVEVDRDDAFVYDHSLTAEYSVPSIAIVIKKATVGKY
jgi:cyclophilin family peptidyl-prolyl cis-trans isomerase